MTPRQGFALSVAVSLALGAWVNEPWRWFDDDVGLSELERDRFSDQASKLLDGDPSLGPELLESLIALDVDLELIEEWRLLLESIGTLSESSQLRFWDRVSVVCESEDFRVEAISHLSRLKAWDLLAEISVRDEKGRNRSKASEAIAQSTEDISEVATDFLVEASFDRDPSVRLFATRALGRSSSSKSVDIALSKRCSDSEVGVQRAAWASRIQRFVEEKSTLDSTEIPSQVKEDPHLMEEPGMKPIQTAPRFLMLGIPHSS